MPDAIATSVTNTNPNSCVYVQTERLCKPWNISNDGLAFMSVCESGILNGTYKGMPVVDGMILEVYIDSKGYPTVGFGHKVLPEDNLHVGDTISVDRARQLSKKNLHEATSAVNRRIHVPLMQYEFDALASIALNAGGGGGFAGISTEVNKGVYANIPAFIRTYRAGGIAWRRALEARLFGSANYDATHGPGIVIE
ncbi:glycoside hydrolase family protein [Paraburkholderia bannensis]|uniref:glycoside hydrolase family protein n=1 Tax=Paraburkholderia bannensis TaxID=765414 RepID=UPI002ABE7807|nr:glycoside hydrolase family protein [Paraburkholderia bannensis]